MDGRCHGIGCSSRRLARRRRLTPGRRGLESPGSRASRSAGWVEVAESSSLDCRMRLRPLHARPGTRLSGTISKCEGRELLGFRADAHRITESARTPTNEGGSTMAFDLRSSLAEVERPVAPLAPRHPLA